MDVTSSDLRGRETASQLAASDPKAALKCASAIKHPWYRCQSLAAAAEGMHGKERTRALSKAIAAAREQSEPNRVVTVATWPLKVMAATDLAKAEEWVIELVATARTEPHPLRRAHALQALAFSVRTHPSLLRHVVAVLAEALLGGYGPRIDRIIRDTYELVRSSRPDLLRSLALHHKPNRQQSKLLASLTAQREPEYA